MHARFELPSSLSTRTVLAVRVATRRPHSVKVDVEAGDHRRQRWRRSRREFPSYIDIRAMLTPRRRSRLTSSAREPQAPAYDLASNSVEARGKNFCESGDQCHRRPAMAAAMTRRQ